ncbi:MAG: hypothetical protein ACR2KV_17800 [Solirubrobacteraceae bacterium]
MLGRKSYTQEVLDHGRSAVDAQLAAYKRLAAASSDASAREEFDGQFFNNMTLVLDRYFVHRLRVTTGKDGNPLNEVELICESLMNNDAVLRGNNVIKYVPEQSVVKLNLGDRIRLSAGEFERLSSAFFAELERRFL